MSHECQPNDRDNILIIDDTPNNLRVLSALLDKHGYEVRKALTGSMALTAARIHPPDLILLDIMMPNMDGYEVCLSLKADDRTKDIPIIFLSALDEPMDKVRAFQVGGSDYITKPFNREEVLARIANQLRLKLLQQQLRDRNTQLQQEVRDRVIAQTQLQQFSDRLKQLHRLNTQYYSTLEARFQAYLVAGCESLGLSTGLVSRLQNADYMIDAIYSNRSELHLNLTFNLSNTYGNLVVREQRTIARDRVGDDPQLNQTAFYQKFQLETYIGTPLWVDGEIYGMLEFAATAPRARSFCAEEIELIELMSQTLAKSITTHQADTRRKQAEMALRIAKQKSENLLLNILPRPIAEQLKQNPSAIAEQFDDVTILFADLVGFTPLASQLSPIELMQLLNQVFSTFDRLAEQYGLEKIKTIGDAYMVVGGLPVPKLDRAEAMAEMALAMQAAMATLSLEQLNRVRPGKPFQIRIGMNTGSVVAGVIGLKKFIYDLWGDAVNIASRMESQGEPGKIQVTEQTYHRLKHQYQFEQRGKIPIKGKGEITTYWLVGRHERGNRQ